MTNTTKKFECRQCHHRFEADDKGVVVCPKCQSDNVDYAHFHIPAKVWKWGIAALVVVVAGCLLSQVRMCDGSGSANVEEGDSLIVAGDSDTIAIAAIEVKDLPVPPHVDIKGGKPAFKDDGYAFSVTIKHAPQEQFYVAVLDCDDHRKVIAKADDDLTFTGVPASDNAQYDIGVFDAATDALLGYSTRSGFIRQEKVASKMSIAELQKLIDSDDPSLKGRGANAQISPDCELRCTGLSDGDAAESLTDVLRKLKFEEWSAVVVTDLKYDDKNRVSVITIKVEGSDNR